MNNILCLNKGTSILMSDNSVKNIEDVKPGDLVISIDIHTQIVHNVTVQKIASTIHETINHIILANGNSIECTIDHPIWTRSKGWCSVDMNSSFKNYNLVVKKLELGDECLVMTGNSLDFYRVTHIETQKGSFEMYDISGGEHHCFFANNILVHDENLTELYLEEKPNVKYESIALVN